MSCNSLSEDSEVPISNIHALFLGQYKHKSHFQLDDERQKF